MIDFEALLYGPIAATLGQRVEVTLSGGAKHALTLIDRTAVVPQDRGGIEVATLEPAAEVLASDLAAAGLSRRDLDRASFTLSGNAWRVISSQSMRTPSGEAGVTLFLADAI